MQFVPIINSIGYEFAVLNSLLLFIISGISTFYFLKTGNNFPSISFKLYIIYFLIPVTISVINSFNYGFNFVFEGISFYVLIVLPSLLLGISISYFIHNVFKQFRKTIFVILFFILFIPILLEYYFYPQIYFYNSLISYYPGTIYDEELLINFKFVTYRVIIFAFSFLLIYLALQVKKQTLKRINSILIICTSVILFVIFKPLFGFATNETRTLKILSTKIETEHFIINFSSRITKDDITRLTNLHEYYYDRIKETVHFEPTRKIKSFVYYNADEKGLLFGSKAADVSKPWLYQIYLNYQTINASLQHELVHSFSAEIGVTPLKVANSFNAALIEGFAMAIDDSLGKNNINYIVFLAKQNGYNVPFKRLFSNSGFFSTYSGLSYYFAGSFIKYLISQYGLNSVINLYKTLDIQKTFHKSIEKLENEYSVYLQKQNFIPNKYTAKYYFGYKPFISKICPRYEIKMINYADELVDKKQYSKAKEIYFDIYDKTNSYNSLYGAVFCLVKQKKYNLAFNLLDKEIDKFYNSSSYFNLKYVLGEVYLKLGNYEKSKKIFNELKNYEITEVYSLSVINILNLTNYDTDLANRFVFSSPKIELNIVEKIKNIKLKKRFYFLYLKNSSSFYDSLSTNDFDKNDKFVSYNFYLISEKLFQLNKFELAKSFIVESLLLNKNKVNYCLFTNQLRKINWFINLSAIN